MQFRDSVRWLVLFHLLQRQLMVIILVVLVMDMVYGFPTDLVEMLLLNDTMEQTLLLVQIMH
ncbi:MAG: hypothetical protein EBT13_13675 [Rhodobacteraceae bacterium]|nr:hypothetical protein [Paracoccaceae bacterium]